MLEEMFEAATIHRYIESEQVTGWFTIINENLAVPFETNVFGAPVTVEHVSWIMREISGAASRPREYAV